MNAIQESLETLRTRMMEEADEQDGYAHGEILAGNVVKEQAYRSAAAGLRMAAGIVTEEMEFQRLGEEIDSKTPEEIRADLHAAGYTDEDIDRATQRFRAVAERAIASRSNTELTNGGLPPLGLAAGSVALEKSHEK